MNLFRPDVQRIAAYIPGEQPQQPGWVKLNTNENPYPPSPHVVEAIEAAARGRLNIYPDPLARRFCLVAGEVLGVDPDWILPGNGSDECLTILMRSFVDPGELVCYPYPSYVLYETLAGIQGGRVRRLWLNEDFSWNLEAARPTLHECKLLLVPNPNSPSGNRWSDGEILDLLPRGGLLVLDEAYIDFADPPHGTEVLGASGGERIVMTRTLSKSYSLAGIRFGFAVAHPDLIRGMRKVKDSYNVNTLSLAAAIAAIQDQQWMRQNVERIRATRSRLTSALRDLGYRVIESYANFVWATHASRPHRSIYEALKAQRILVRYMLFPEGNAEGGELEGLRISVGTDEEIDHLLAAMRQIV